MIILRQKVYAVVTPLSLAKEVVQGGKSLQSVVEGQKTNLNMVVERWQRLHPGKRVPRNLVQKHTKQINEAQQLLQNNIQSGLQQGIPEQYAERSVLGDLVGQRRIAASDDSVRASRRFLRERQNIKNKFTAEHSGVSHMEFDGMGGRPLPSIEQHFVKKHSSQQSAAERLKRIIKSREPYLPDEVINKRVENAMLKKDIASIRAEEHMKNIRAHSPYSNMGFAETQAARFIAGETAPPVPTVVYGPKWLTGRMESWRGL